MPSRAYTSFLHGLALHLCLRLALRVNALSGLYLISTEATVLCQSSWGYTCQCPLGLIPHFYQRQIVSAANYGYVSMPSRAYTSFLRYPFKNLDFMRFSEPVFAGIYQNILITAVFRAC